MDCSAVFEESPSAQDFFRLETFFFQRVLVKVSVVLFVITLF